MSVLFSSPVSNQQIFALDENFEETLFDDGYDEACGPCDATNRNESGTAGEDWIDIEAISTEMVDHAWGDCAFQEGDLNDYFAAEAADRTFWRDIRLSFGDWYLDDEEVEVSKVGEITINGTAMSANMLDKFDGDEWYEDDWEDEWPDEDDHRGREYEQLPMGFIGSRKIHMIRLSHETCGETDMRARQPHRKGRKHPCNMGAVAIHLGRRTDQFAELAL